MTLPQALFFPKVWIPPWTNPWSAPPSALICPQECPGILHCFLGYIEQHSKCNVILFCQLIKTKREFLFISDGSHMKYSIISRQGQAIKRPVLFLGSIFGNRPVWSRDCDLVGNLYFPFRLDRYVWCYMILWFSHRMKRAYIVMARSLFICIHWLCFSADSIAH